MTKHIFSGASPPATVLHASDSQRESQTQLQQALLAQQMSSHMVYGASRNGPLNSPVLRTPSASISLDPSEAAWARHASVSSTRMRCSIDETQESDEMDEDERMVEDLESSTSDSESPASP